MLKRTMPFWKRTAACVLCLVFSFQMIVSANTFFTLKLESSLNREEAYATFGSTGRENGLKIKISSVSSANNYALYSSYKGRECIETQGASKYIAVDVDDSYVLADDRNVAIKISYFDEGWDIFGLVYKGTGGTQTLRIQKNATDTWRTAVILINDAVFDNSDIHGSDFKIRAWESNKPYVNEHISEISVINLNNRESEQSLQKRILYHETEGAILSKIGIIEAIRSDKNDYGLSRPLTRKEAVRTAIQIVYAGDEELNNAVCTADDVDDEYDNFIGFALDKGIISYKTDSLVGADDIITMRELMEIFARANNIEISNDVIFDLEQYGLINNLSNPLPQYLGATINRGANIGLYIEEVTSLDSYAYVDDLAGIAYNQLSINSPEGKAYIAELVNSEIIYSTDVINCGNLALLYKYYEAAGFNLIEESYVDSKTGITVNTIGLPGTHTVSMYSSASSCADGKNILVTTAVDYQTGKGLMAVYNTETKETTILNNKPTPYFGGVMAPTNEAFYYCDDEVYCYDVKNGQNRLIAQNIEEGKVFYGPPGVTNDAKYLSLYRKSDESDRLPRNIYKLNIESGEMKEVMTPEMTKTFLEAPVNHIDHVIINPVYDNEFFFCRNSGSIADRMHMFNSETGKERIYVQSQTDENGKLEEYTGHEIWAFDGEGMYFVRYGQSIPQPTGLMWVSLDGETLINYNNDYSYLHMGVSFDGNQLIADTPNQFDGENWNSKIVLVDVDKENSTSTSRLLTEVNNWGMHPAHSHPAISIDGSKALFTLSDPEENNIIKVGYIDIENLPPIDQKNSVASIDFTSEEKRNGIEPLTSGGFARTNKYDKDCILLEKSAKIYFDVSPDFVTSNDNVVTIEVGYYDNGTGRIDIDYNTCNLEEDDPGLRDSKKYSWYRTNTNKWVTHTVTLKDAGFRNAMFLSDFRLNSVGSSTAIYIDSVRVTSGANMPEKAVEENSVEDVSTITAFGSDKSSMITLGGRYDVANELSEDGGSYAVLSDDSDISFTLANDIEVKNNTNITLLVEYLNNGSGSIPILYNSSYAYPGLPSSEDYKEVSIKRTNSATWETAMVTLTDTEFAGRQFDGADFRITSKNSTLPIYIRNLKIVTSEE